MIPFVAFPKIPRLRRDIVITEKIDGTNAQILIPEPDDEIQTIYAGSRNRLLLPGQSDNQGFAAWVALHADELRAGLGPGRHFGEWWGAGIGRKYGLKEKRFSLFNTGRWTAETPPPACCGVVPIFYRGLFSDLAVESALSVLRTHGSFAAPGFDKPEGIIIYHEAAGQYFKVLLENDAIPKGFDRRLAAGDTHERSVRTV